jgi:hypothetical protein
MIYILISFITIVYGAFIHAMNEPIRKLDFSKKDLPVWLVPRLDHKNFEHLITDNASLLYSLVAVEQRGCYCPALHEAETILWKKRDMIREKGVLARQYKCPSTIVHFIRLITHRNQDRGLLIDALSKDNHDDISTICKRNPYAVNAYALYPKYGGIACPLHYALFLAGRTRNEEEEPILSQCIRYLLNRGACSNAIDHDGDVPLHKVSQIEHIRMLWLMGADSNRKNNDGMTPVMKHSSNNREDLALFLVKNGVDATLRDNDGNTLLHYAVRQNHVILADILLGDGIQFEIDNRLYNSVALCVFDIANQCAETPALLSRASNQQMRYLMEQYILLYLCKAFINKRYYTILDFLYKYDWINKDLFFNWIQEYHLENIEGFRETYEKMYSQVEVKQNEKNCIRK